MSVRHIIKANINSSSLGRPINQITPPGIGSNGLVCGNSAVISSATALAPTAAQLPNGVFYTTAGSTATFTPPLASEIYAYLVSIGIQPSIGSSFSFQIDNQNSGNLTLATSTGVTYTASTTVATAVKRTYVFRFSAVSSPAGVIY